MNNLSDELNIAYPIFNAGMAFIAGPELASQVTLAGGLGYLGAGMLPVPLVEQEFASAKALSNGGPIGIDFLSPFFSDEHLAFVLSERPDVAAFFYGLPEATQLAAMSEQGTRIWAIVNTLAEAQEARDARVHAIVLQGSQAGGHNRATERVESLYEEIAREMPDMHLIIAGGIVTGRDVASALESGASGVWCGTVFLASEEANAQDGYKAKVVDCQAGETEITRAFGPEWPDEPMRVYKNTAVKALTGDAEHPDVESIGTSYIGGQAVDMPRYSAILPMKSTEGDADLMALTMGTEASRVAAVRPVREIMAELSGQLMASKYAQAS